MSQVEKPKHRRSRNGCMSCKRMHIKCDELKPSCTHCNNRNRMCIYRANQNWGSNENSPSESLEKSQLTLNSAASQLHVSHFQFRLFKYFLDFAGDFFSRGLNPQIHTIWAQEVPSLFVRSELVRTAVYALSSVNLWANYKLADVPNVMFYDDNKPVSLLVDTSHRFSNLLSDLANTRVTGTIENDLPILIANIVLVAYLGVHPSPPVKLADLSGSGVPDVLSLCKSQAEFRFQVKPLLEGTLFEHLAGDPKFLIIEESELNFETAILQHLQNYIATNTMMYDVVHLQDYIIILNRLQGLVHRCIKGKTYLPIYKVLPLFTFGTVNFDDLVRSRDYIAMKILFYYCAFCQISRFSFSTEASIWDYYMDEYMQNWSTIDPFDNWLFQTTRVHHFKIVPSEIEQLKEFGRAQLMQGFGSESSCIEEIGEMSLLDDICI